jgi:molecular chaperone GrpE
MSESPPPGAAEVAAVGAAQGLTGEAIEDILSDFRAWLRALPADVPLPSAAEEAPDLHTLLAQFVALRHEVNLQTKANRGQQEQTAEALRLLRQAVDALDQSYAVARGTQQSPEEDRLRPLLKTLVDLYDALALAAREVLRVQDGLAPLLEQMTPAVEEAVKEPTPLPPTPAPPWWRRLFGARPADSTALTGEVVRLRGDLCEERRRRAELATRARSAAERVRQAVGSVVTGYGMSVQRVERALRQHGLEVIPAAGQPFDPERMEVVEAVEGSGRPSGEVLEEVRRGYLWNDRVFRCAQVRVAKG